MKKNEINGDFYCSAGLYKDGDCRECLCGCQTCKVDCENYHRKHPTPKQYKKEYGREWPDDGAVYCQHHSTNWFVSYWENAIDAYKAGNCLVVCACTPFGKPPQDWRPK